MNSEKQSLATALERVLARSSASSSSSSEVVTYRLPREDTTGTSSTGAVFHFLITTSGLLNKPPGPPWFQTMLGPGSAAEREAALEAGRRERSPRRSGASKHN